MTKKKPWKPSTSDDEPHRFSHTMRSERFWSVFLFIEDRASRSPWRWILRMSHLNISAESLHSGSTGSHSASRHWTKRAWKKSTAVIERRFLVHSRVSVMQTSHSTSISSSGFLLWKHERPWVGSKNCIKNSHISLIQVSICSKMRSTRNIGKRTRSQKMRCRLSSSRS